MNIPCSQICNYLNLPLQGSDVAFNAVSTDTRSIQPGALFIAIKGANFDGHDYIAEALAKGAAGLVVSKPYTANVPVLVVADTLWAYGHRRQHRSGDRRCERTAARPRTAASRGPQS